jgi:hypothetical protein
MPRVADHHTSPSTQNLKFPDWQREFEAALLEVDPQKLSERVKAAQASSCGNRLWFIQRKSWAILTETKSERSAL